MKEKTDKWVYVRRNLSPFDKVVCDLVIDNRVKLDYEHLPSLLSELDEARKGLVKRGKRLAGEVKGCKNRREVEGFLEVGVDEVSFVL